MQASEVWLWVPPKVKMEMAAFSIPLSLTDVVFRHSVGCVSLRTGGPHTRQTAASVTGWDCLTVERWEQENKWLRLSLHATVALFPWPLYCAKSNNKRYCDEQL